jgi:hypothetical protein
VNWVFWFVVEFLGEEKNLQDKLNFFPWTQTNTKSSFLGSLQETTCILESFRAAGFTSSRVMAAFLY